MDGKTDGRMENWMPISTLAKAGATKMSFQPKIINARVDVNFARVDIKFQTVTVTLFCYKLFSFLIPINIKILLILHTKFQPNIPSHFGEMDLNARVDVNVCMVYVNFQTAIVT